MQGFGISISTLRPWRLGENRQPFSLEFEVPYDLSSVAMRVQTA